MKKSKKIITRIINLILKKFFLKTVYPSYVFLKTSRNFKKRINIEKQFNKFSENLDKINDYEFKLTSENNEDGIIDYIFKVIPNSKKFVEIGFGYYECNSLNLIKNGWSGKLIDINIDEVIALKKNLNSHYPLANVEVINSKVTRNNIDELVHSKNFNTTIDFFSIDVDSNDYWILKKMNLSNINVVCAEYNHWLGKDESLTIEYNENFKFQDNGLWGVSLKALTQLLKNKEFSLIAVDSAGSNAFFVNNKYSDKFEILSSEKSYRSVGKHYNDERKKEIFNNVRENLNKLIKIKDI
jgi:hypothetical protein